MHCLAFCVIAITASLNFPAPPRVKFALSGMCSFECRRNVLHVQVFYSPTPSSSNRPSASLICGSLQVLAAVTPAQVSAAVMRSHSCFPKSPAHLLHCSVASPHRILAGSSASPHPIPSKAPPGTVECGLVDDGKGGAVRLSCSNNNCCSQYGACPDFRHPIVGQVQVLQRPCTAHIGWKES